MMSHRTLGKDFIEHIMNRVLRIYARVLRNDNDPLRENEILGPIIKKLESPDPEAVLDLLEHSTIMTMHAFFDHLIKFQGDSDEYSFELLIISKDGTRSTIFDYSDDLGMALVEDGGWADQFANFR